MTNGQKMQEVIIQMMVNTVNVPETPKWRHISIDELSPNSQLAYVLDSLELITLVMNMEEKFSTGGFYLSIPDVDLHYFETVESTADYIKRRIPKKIYNQFSTSEGKTQNST